MSERKSIFEYDDFRAFVRDRYQSMKARDSKYSFRFLARQAGFQSPNFIKLVMDGQRNLSPASIEKFAHALKLNKEESTFFRNLIMFNQATSTDERYFYAEQLLRSRSYKKIRPLQDSQYKYYSNWYFVAVRELVNTIDFHEDPKWIASRLTPPITAAEAEEALEELQKLGLLARNDEGRLVQTDKNVGTPVEVTSLAVAQFAREMMRKATESIDRHSREKREISSVTIALNDDNMKKVKEMIQKFRREILEVVSTPANNHAVYQLNFQLFPLAEPNGSQKK